MFYIKSPCLRSKSLFSKLCRGFDDILFVMRKCNVFFTFPDILLIYSSQVPVKTIKLKSRYVIISTYCFPAKYCLYVCNRNKHQRDVFVTSRTSLSIIILTIQKSVTADVIIMAVMRALVICKLL